MPGRAHARIQPDVLKEVAMQRQRAHAAGRLVQAVHVLGDQRESPRVALLERGDGMVPGVGMHVLHHLAAARVPIPDAPWIGSESRLGGEFLGPELRPQPGLGITKRRHTRFGAHASAAQHRNGAGITNPGANGGDIGDGGHVPALLPIRSAGARPRTGTPRWPPKRSGSRRRHALESRPVRRRFCA